MNQPGQFAQLMKAKLRLAIRLALIKVGNWIIEELQLTVSKPVLGHGKRAIRSEPGEAPYREYSVLFNSFKKSVSTWAQGTPELSVFTDLIRAAWLEHGTDKIEARPFWNVTIRRIASRIVPFFRECVVEYLTSKVMESEGD